MRANEITIKDFVGGYDKVFLIPPFQRNYAWDQKNCKELWEDFEKATLNGTSHYLGNIIYYPSVNTGAAYTELILVDGQQRLTTILLLLAAIRDNTADKLLKKNIQDKYLKNATEDSKYRVKLKTIISDDDDFSRIIEGKLDKSHNSIMLANYNFFVNQVLTTKLDLTALFETIAKSEIVDINLQANNNLELVQTVFEKINSTGKPLTSADLIRNLLLSSNSPDEQNRLYRDYWAKIEQTLGIDNVPDFVSDYLLIKTTLQSISNKEVYEKFKQYMQTHRYSNKEILAQLLEYSGFYKFLINANCPNIVIAKNIKEINILKAADLLPVLLLLLYKMFDNDQKELEDIFSLFADFTLRYRLVGDYSGGGALQSTIRQIINKLNDGTIAYKYSDILFELSNSNTRDGEYPIDERFAEKITNKMFSSDEAKILLSRIEYYENKDIQIPMEKLTLEHIMPRTLSLRWKAYLGFEDNDLMKFHSEYLWNLGNLTLLSGSWNSSLSNKMFNDKITFYKDNQFRMTRDIINTYDSWGREEIEERAQTMAQIAVKSTRSPIQRTRPYQKERMKETSAGQYFLYDEVKTEHTKIMFLNYQDQRIECKNWYMLFTLICKIAYDYDKERFEYLVEKNLVAKAKKSKENYDKHNFKYDPMISKRKDIFVSSMEINKTSYYCESKLSSASARVHSLNLIKQMGMDDTDFIIELE